MKINKGDRFNLECISVNNYAKGVSKIDSLLVFVDDFYPGEKALVELTDVKKNYAFGRIIELTEKSPYRIEPVCDHDLESGTCPFNDITYEYECELKKTLVKSNIERALKKDIGDIEIISGESIEGYRNKVTVFFSKEKGKTVFGTFKEGTHDFVKIGSCVQISNEIKDVINNTISLIDKYSLSVADFKRKTGLIKGMVVRRSEYTSKMSIMILSTKNSDKFFEFAKELSSKNGLITGISVSVSDNYDTFIYSGMEKQYYGNPYIEEKIMNIVFKVNNMSFLQVNTSCASRLYEYAIKTACLKKTDTILDLYSGCGGISLNAANRVKKVYGVETVKSAVELARKNAIYNDIKNATFQASDALDYKMIIGNIKPDVVFTDPPRSGMDKKVIESLLNLEPEKIVYVSCDSYTMANNLKDLSVKYEISNVRCFNQFPRTKHVESVSCLSRIENFKNNSTK